LFDLKRYIDETDGGSVATGPTDDNDHQQAGEPGLGTSVSRTVVSDRVGEPLR
jgi:hypothetical protein